MDGLGDQLFSRATLTVESHDGIRGGNLDYLTQDVLHLLAGGHHVVIVVALLHHGA
jgi:hypothetical protein